MKFLIFLLFSFSLQAIELDNSKIAIMKLKELDKVYKAQDAKCASLNLHADLLAKCTEGSKARILATVEQIFANALHQVEKQAGDESSCVQKCQALFDSREPALSYSGSESCKQLNVAWKAAENIDNCGR